MTPEAAIADFIAGLDEDADVRRLLDLSVGRVLRAAGKRGEEYRPDQQKAAHVADWLRASVVRKEAWLANVDDLKRPRKLLKFSRFEDIVKEADKAMRAANARDGVSSSGDGQTLYRDLENGYRFVQLHTREALQRESSRMGHCVGNGG
jgi:alpha-L-fucosidase